MDVAVLIVSAPKFNKPEEGTPSELWGYSSKVMGFISVCEENNIPWVLIDYKHGIIKPDQKLKNYSNPEAEITLREWQKMIVEQAADLGLVFLNGDGGIGDLKKNVTVAHDHDELVQFFKNGEQLSDKKYPFAKEGAQVGGKKRVAATFCAGSKVALDEGTPKELWASASPRIGKFIEHCERNNIDYVILSYKYGVVDKNEVIDNYDIGRSQLDMDEWKRLVESRATELGIKEIIAFGMLAKNSPEISSTLENLDGVTLVWADSYDEITEFFYKDTTLDDFAKQKRKTDEKEQEKKDSLKLSPHTEGTKAALIADVDSYDPADVSDEVLRNDHAIVHAWWATLLAGKEFKYTKEQVKHLHDSIAKEMVARGMEHNSPLANLPNVKQLQEMPEIVKTLALDELQGLAKVFEELGADNSIIINELNRRGGETSAQVQDSRGSRLELDSGQSNSDVRSDDEGGDALQTEGATRKQVLRDPSVEAKKSLEEDTVVPSRFFYPLKGIVGYRRTERYTPEGVKSFFKETDYPLIVQKKYDGARHIIWKDSDKVTILSDGGLDVTDRLPTVVKELQSFPHQVCLDTEIEQWEKGVHNGREIVSGYLRSKDQPVNDKGILVNVFDILYFNDPKIKKHDLNGQIGDLHKQPYSLRLQYLELCPFRQSTLAQPERNLRMNLAPSFVVKNGSELVKELKKVAKAPGSEGAMVKMASSDYPLDGMTNKWVKYKTMAEVHVVVLKRIETRTKGVYVYEVGLGFTSNDSVFENDVKEVKGQRYLFVGKTLATKAFAEPGEIATISFHTLFLYTDRKSGAIRIRLYEPRWYELRKDQTTPDNIREAINIAEGAKLLQEKELTLMRLSGADIVDDELLQMKGMKRWAEQGGSLSVSLDDVYLEIPPENKVYEFVFQHEYHGKSAHGDLRLELPDYLIGWTLNILPEGAIKEDITTIEQARKISETVKWKDYNQDEKILTEKKDAKIPKGWLSVEGERGDRVFVIYDKGTIEYGAQLPYFHEYFIKGKKFRGRIVFRMVPNLDKEPDDEREFLWMTWKPKDQTPYVLTKRSIQKGYRTDFGISALPIEVRKKIPRKYHYWNERDADKRFEVRKELVEAIANGLKFSKLYKVVGGKHQWIDDVDYDEAKFIYNAELEDGTYKLIPVNFTQQGDIMPTVFEVKDGKIKMATAKFVVQHHWWKAARVTKRPEASVEHYDIRFDFGPSTKSLVQFVCEKNPLVTDRTVALRKQDRNKSSFNAGRGKVQQIRPGTALNPTKDTPAYIEIIDEGKATIHVSENALMKVEFFGSKLKGFWTFRQVNKGVWVVEKEVLSTNVKQAMKVGESIEHVLLAGSVISYEETKDGLLVKGGAITHGTWNGLYFPPDVIEESYDLFPGVRITLEHDQKRTVGKYVASEFKDQMIYLSALATEPDVIKKIKNGDISGFSIDAWISVDRTRRIVLRIVEYNDVSFVKNPACSICLLT